MKKKIRRFDVGGDVREGQHAGIDDDTRARARAFVREQGMQDLLKDLGEGPKASAPKPAAPKPAASSSSSIPTRSKYVGSSNDAGDEGAPRSRTYVGSSNDAGDEGAPSFRGGQYSPEAKAARQARSAANAERGGMTPEAERAVERAGNVAATVIPAARGIGAAAKVGQKAAEAVGRQAAVRKGLAKEAEQWGASAPPANRVSNTVKDIRNAAREASAQREAARKARDEAAAQSRSMREEARQFGSNLPKSLRERAEEAGASVAGKAKRMFSRQSPKSNKPRFAESADDASQTTGFKKGGKVGASRGDGIAQRGHTRGRYL